MGTLIANAGQRKKLHKLFGEFVRAARVPRFRSMAEFAVSEIRLPPGGPLAGSMLNLDSQPWTRMWLNEVDSHKYVFHVLVALVQGGKTLFGWVLPTMYHLFERGESVTCVVPDMNMAYTKWEDDLLPILMASRYRHLIPLTGVGTKGGKKIESITFLNGAKLRFVGAAGGDATRSGFTTRVAVLTEVNKYKALSTSKEAGPIAQIFGRLQAHELSRMRIYMECTVDEAVGEIWTRFLSGTASQIRVPCPKCGVHVGLERADLQGWQQAPDEVTAMELAHYCCPSCAAPWTEPERIEANKRGRLVARGQEITPDGTVTGEAPRTLTFSMRVNIASSNLKPTSDIGWQEWDARHQPDDDGEKDKALQQFKWVMPWGGEADHEGITPEIVASRLTGIPQGECPEDTETLAVHFDLHDAVIYWTIVAAGESRGGQPPAYSYIDYGISFNPDLKVYGPEDSLRLGLRKLATELQVRRFTTVEGRIVPLSLGLIDAGYKQDIAVEFLTERGGIWRLGKGQGRKDAKGQFKNEEKQTHEWWPGHHWVCRRQDAIEAANNRPWWMFLIDTNFWMHQLHAGFMKTPWLTDDKGDVQRDEFDQPIRRPGSCALFGDRADEHLRNQDATIHRSNFAAQVCGWIYKSAKTVNRGEQIDWHSQWSQDHFGDNGYNLLAATSIATAIRASQQVKEPGEAIPDKRPFVRKTTATKAGGSFVRRG